MTSRLCVLRPVMLAALLATAGAVHAPLSAKAGTSIDGATTTAVDPAVARAARQLREQGTVQTQIPEVVEPPRTPMPDWLLSIFEWFSQAMLWLFGGAGNLMRAFIIVMAAAAVLAILYMSVPAVRAAIDGLLRGRSRNTKAEDDTAFWQPDQESARDLLAQAEMLAAQGQYAEAVHLLLGRSLQDIAAFRPDALKPAMTARTIAEIEAIPPDSRQAFANIATIVERGIWAKRPLDAAAWDEARAAYTSFALGPQWRVAA